jgi:hypothetical protein
MSRQARNTSVRDYIRRSTSVLWPDAPPRHYLDWCYGIARRRPCPLLRAEWLWLNDHLGEGFRMSSAYENLHHSGHPVARRLLRCGHSSTCACSPDRLETALSALSPRGQSLTRNRRPGRKVITAEISMIAERGPGSVPGPATSCYRLLAGVHGGDDLIPFCRQRKLKDGAPRLIRAGPRPSPVRLDNRTADRQAHAHPRILCAVEGL